MWNTVCVWVQVWVQVYVCRCDLGSTIVPPLLSPAGLRSHCSSLTGPEHAWAAWSTECVPYLNIELSFLSSCPDIAHLFSDICYQEDSRRFFHCSLSKLCMLLSAWIYGEPSTNSHIRASVPCLCIRTTSCRSSRIPIVPGWTECVRGYGMERSHQSHKLDFQGQTCLVTNVSVQLG